MLLSFCLCCCCCCFLLLIRGVALSRTQGASAAYPASRIVRLGTRWKENTSQEQMQTLMREPNRVGPWQSAVHCCFTGWKKMRAYYTCLPRCICACVCVIHAEVAARLTFPVPALVSLCLCLVLPLACTKPCRAFNANGINTGWAFSRLLTRGPADSSSSTCLLQWV